jgi:hypothetical protein
VYQTNGELGIKETTQDINWEELKDDPNWGVRRAAFDHIKNNS